MGSNGETRQIAILDENECVSLLNQHSIGRVGFIAAGRPHVLPVNYVVDEDGRTILFRTSPNSMIMNAPMTDVAFEVDSVDVDDHLAWSVLIKGHARDVTTAIDEGAERLRNLEPSPWIPGDKSVWIAIAATEITGRRIA